MIVHQILMLEDSVVLKGLEPSPDIPPGGDGENCERQEVSYNEWLNFKAQVKTISIPFVFK